MEIIRVLNNNAAIVRGDDDVEIVVLGKGIAHGKKRGERLDDAAVVDQVFRPDSRHPVERIAAYLSDIPLDVVRCAALVAERAHERLGIRVSQALILPLADHLAFAIDRVRRGIEMDYPLRWEVSQLYPREVAVGREAVDLAAARLGVVLPADEAISFALHFVNAAFASEGMAPTIHMTERIGRVLEVVSQSMGVTLDAESMNVARFVTHLRYLFVRLDADALFDDPSAELLSGIRASHPAAYACAQRVRYLLEMGGARLTEDEVLYLALHVARVTTRAKTRTA